METIEKTDFDEWKHHPVTETIFGGLARLIYEGQSELANQAGDDPKMDLIRRGKLIGLATLLNLEFEDLT